MAVLRRGPIGDVSGRLGGVEFALKGGQSVVKPSKVKRSRVSERAYWARSNLVYSQRLWAGLTDAQRLSWDWPGRHSH